MKNPVIQKRLEFFKTSAEDNEESSLLQTIRIPKNLLFLTDKLPQANYEKLPNKKSLSFTKQNADLPSVNQTKPKLKKPKKSKGEGASLAGLNINHLNVINDGSKSPRQKKDTSSNVAIMPRHPVDDFTADRPVKTEAAQPINNIRVVKNNNTIDYTIGEGKPEREQLVLPSIKVIDMDRKNRVPVDSKK